MAVSSTRIPAVRGKSSARLSQLSDELLSRYAARESERAFAALYERYHQAVYGYCRSILRNDADAQDALQSTFAAAFSALRQRQRNAPLRPWLFRIAHNESITLIRRRNRDGERALADGGPSFASSAEDQAVVRARWELVVADLHRLPERPRGALLLRELNGLSHEEIATALGTTVGGAKQAIFEARQALFELAQGREMECEQIRRRISDGDGRALRRRGVRAHLQVCVHCQEFASAIRSRRGDLRALTPVLAPAAAADVFSRVLHSAPGHGGCAAAPASTGASAATAGAAGKAAGVAVAWKAAAAVAVLVTAATGVAGLTPVFNSHHSHMPATEESRFATSGGSQRPPGNERAFAPYALLGLRGRAADGTAGKAALGASASGHTGASAGTNAADNSPATQTGSGSPSAGGAGSPATGSGPGGEPGAASGSGSSSSAPGNGSPDQALGQGGGNGNGNSGGNGKGNSGGNGNGQDRGLATAPGQNGGGRGLATAPGQNGGGRGLATAPGQNGGGPGHGHGLGQ